MKGTKATRHEGKKARRAIPSRLGAYVPSRLPRSAFTLTEILIVIGIIVLLLALAVPAMRVLSGGRSVDAAENQLSAFLGRARGEAIALQQIRGVMFYKDLTGRTYIAMVETHAENTNVSNPPDWNLDLVADRDVVALPVGVDAQTIDNAQLVGGVRQDEGYIGYNNFLTDQWGTAGYPVTIYAYGGVILFDANGQLTTPSYGFRALDDNGEVSAIYQLLYTGVPTATIRTSTGGRNGVTWSDEPVPPRKRSQIGLVLFDHEQFITASPPYASPPPSVGTPSGMIPDKDPMLQGPGGPRPLPTEEQAEETWLDKNSVPLLINRYNGTLIRGE